jgi:hypothetical protein
MTGIGEGGAAMQGERLSPDEDAALRRLHWFETLGCELSNALHNLKNSFRSRDRRTVIRDPGATYDNHGQQVRSPEQKKNADNYWAR